MEPEETAGAQVERQTDLDRILERFGDIHQDILRLTDILERKADVVWGILPLDTMPSVDNAAPVDIPKGQPSMHEVDRALSSVFSALSRLDAQVSRFKNL